MAAVCDVCGKGPGFGMSVSHSHRRTRRRWEPNLQRHRYWLPSERRWITLRLTTKAMRTVDRDGIETVVARLRAEGIDVVGYTWWPLFHFVEWEYRESDSAPEEHLFEMGLFDLRPNDVGVLERVRTPVVDRFRAHASRGAPEFVAPPAAKETAQA